MGQSLLTNCLCFSVQQQAHIPASIVAVLEANKKPQPKPAQPVVEKEVMDQHASHVAMAKLLYLLLRVSTLVPLNSNLTNSYSTNGI